MFLDLAYKIVERWWPPQVLQDEAARFTNLSLDMVLVVALFAYLLYRVVLWRFWRTEDPGAVGSLRGPWWLGMIIGMVLHFTITLIMGLSMIPDKDAGIVVTIIVTAFAEAIIIALLFWVFSLFSSPMRCWLAPIGRPTIFRILRINR